MAQNPVIAQVGTTGLITSATLVSFTYVAWSLLLVMSALSVAMMAYGHVRLMRGKHVLATTARRRKDKPD